MLFDESNETAVADAKENVTDTAIVEMRIEICEQLGRTHVEELYQRILNGE